MFGLVGDTERTFHAAIKNLPATKPGELSDLNCSNRSRSVRGIILQQGNVDSYHAAWQHGVRQPVKSISRGARPQATASTAAGEIAIDPRVIVQIRRITD